ncbi:MAG TPA: efflux RND transporter periplasmic adaptor subunit [Deltaproteobacteria bacterium]|nr:efflux RND transporter periplasmic adaptor subunit [Deltaproteobacteria bacterium]HPP81085.1 efflux RND transporter periplasmic adaptor subunit [Deltaproteobacteria bacterium]
MQTQSGPRPRKAVLLLVILAAACAGLFAWRVHSGVSDRDEAPASEKVPVSTVPAAIGNVERVLRLTGDVRPWREVDVFPKVPGKIIERIFFDRGDTVRSGDTIALLEMRSIEAQVREAEAAFRLAGTNLDLTRKDYARIENLYAEKAVARQRLDHVQAQLESAEAQLDRSKAVLDQLRILMAEHTVRSPIGGVISARYVDPGALSAPGAPIVRVSDESRLKIVASVTEKDYLSIAKGMRCEVTSDAVPGAVFEGEIALVNPTLSPSGRSADIEIHVDNAKKGLKAGMFAHVRISLGVVSGVVVEKDAVQRLPGTGAPYVYVVEDGKAVMKNIETGPSQGDVVLVASGLAPGERVVVTGQNRLKDGTAVLERPAPREPGVQ